MLLSVSVATILSSVLLVANAVPVQLQERAACATGVHIIVARASTEAQGEGISGQVASQIEARIPGSDSEAVVYPATLNNYLSSESMGATAMSQLVDSYASRCPTSKIVLMGYSQGAQVVGDVINGAGNTRATTAKNIAAVIQMGDPSFVLNTPGNVGTSTRSGVFPRRDTSKVKNFNVQSYCDMGDTFCASGSSTAVHLGYVNKYGSQITNYVVGKANSFVVRA